MSNDEDRFKKFLAKVLPGIESPTTNADIEQELAETIADAEGENFNKFMDYAIDAAQNNLFSSVSVLVALEDDGLETMPPEMMVHVRAIWALVQKIAEEPLDETGEDE